MAGALRSSKGRYIQGKGSQRQTNQLANQFQRQLRIDDNRVSVNHRRYNDDSSDDDSNPSDDSSDEDDDVTDIDDRPTEMRQKRGSNPMFNFNSNRSTPKAERPNPYEQTKTSRNLVIAKQQPYQQSKQPTTTTRPNYSFPSARPRLGPPLLDTAPTTPLWRRRKRQSNPPPLPPPATGLQRRRAVRKNSCPTPPPLSPPSTPFEGMDGHSWSDPETPVTPIEMDGWDGDRGETRACINVITRSSSVGTHGLAKADLCGFRNREYHEDTPEDIISLYSRRARRVR